MLYSFKIVPRQLVLAAMLHHTFDKRDEIALQRIDPVIVAVVVALVKAVY